MTNKSMYGYLMQNFADKKDDVAISFLYKNFSYQKLSDEIDAVACFLVNKGIKKGDVITVALPNIPSSVSVFYAINKIGAVANMVHPLVPYEVLKKHMTTTKSKLLFAFDLLLDGFFDEVVQDGFEVVVCRANDYLTKFESFFYTLFGKKAYKQIDKNKCEFFCKAQRTKVFDVVANGNGDDVAVIMHSSGTTQQSKTACLTNKNFNYVAQNVIDVLPWGKQLGKNKASLAVLPTFHAFGLGVTTHTILSFGYQSVMIPKYSAKLIVKKIRAKNVAILAGVPTMFAGIVDQKGFDCKHVKKLQVAFCGGDKLSQKTKQKFDSIIEKNGGSCVLDEGYGLTEASGVLAVNTKKENCVGSVGKAIKGTTVYAFDENGNKLSANQVGELCVSSDGVMKGYLADGQIVADGLFIYDDKLFVKTGDFGFIDNQQFIFFKQRQKRIEKVSGVNVFPAEAEDVLSKIDGVKTCCVKGVPHERKGTVLQAYVLLEKGADKNQVQKQMIEVCEKSLDKWTQPKIYKFVDDLPLTKFGKIDYTKL